MQKHVLPEYFSNGYFSWFALIVSIISIALGIYTITTKNPIISILFLIGLFVTISIYLMLSGLYYIGLSYLLVYVGAISILFVFILMLINVRVSELTSEEKNSILLAVLVVISFNYVVNPVLPYSVQINDPLTSSLLYLYRRMIEFTSGIVNLSSEPYEIINYKTNIDPANVSSYTWDSSMVESNHITSISNIMYSYLFILLIILSLILLLAMVGTIVITIKKKPTYI